MLFTGFGTPNNWYISYFSQGLAHQTIDISIAFHRVWHTEQLIYQLLFTGFGTPIFFINSRISDQIFRFVLLLFYNRRLGNLCMASLLKNFHVLLMFLKARYLVLLFSYYTLITFLMILCVTLLSMLMILLSTRNVIRHLICDNNYSWLLN